MLYHRILVTGANGLIGQELVSRLSRYQEYDLLATSRHAAPRFHDNSSGGYIPLDITVPADVRRVFDDFAPNVVVNCAAMGQANECERDRSACWKINVKAVESLARICRRSGARLIQLSTDFVFDGQKGPYVEEDRPKPINFYGRSKLAAENVVRSVGIGRWAIARTVLVYGAGQNLPRSNFALWVTEKLQNRETIRVPTDQWRTPTYAPDVASGIEKMIRYGKDGVFHLSGREFLSVYDFARQIARVYELDDSLIEPIHSTQLNEPAARPPRTGFIILKAETELGYRPYPITHALRHLGTRIGLPLDTER